jgi:hypothetical protein
MNKSIDNIDEAGHYHGYQEWYSVGSGVYWYRGTMFHGKETGYVEQNLKPVRSVQVGDECTEVLYYII